MVMAEVNVNDEKEGESKEVVVIPENSRARNYFKIVKYIIFFHLKIKKKIVYSL